MQVIENNIPQALEPYIKENSIIARSPGRINLIGEHTDYNDGFVLPAAIDKSAFIILTPRNDNEIHLHSKDFNDDYATIITAVKKTDKSWANYILGVVDQFIEKGVALEGFDLILTSDIPIGVGLSSSAAIECATAVALNKYFDAQLDKFTLVKMSQKAEHIFAGVQCGIMDQFTSVFGKAGHVIKLDCRSLEYQYEPFNMNGFKIVLFDTRVKHSLASSEYNVRRKQCEKSVEMIQKKHPEVKSLRDANMDMLNKCVLHEDKLIYDRCRFVIEENIRLLTGCVDLENNDLRAFGKKMFETHHGLSKLYEVSCEELDFLVAQVENNPDVLGARMMGGGFGGCTINLVKSEAVETLIEFVTKAYQYYLHKELRVYLPQIENGSELLAH